MSTTELLLQGVFIMITLITIVILLRKFGVLVKENSKVSGNLVLKVTLPALIFSALVTKKFDYDLLLIAATVAVAEILSLTLAWFGARLLKLSKGDTGALMLVSAFGTSTMLGYPLVMQTFPGNAIAMDDAVITSEIGVGVLLFIIGPIIAMHYGENKFNGSSILTSIKGFILSPIFVAIIAGIGLSAINFPTDNIIIGTLSHVLTIIGNANFLLVAITIGLLLEPHHLKKMIPILIVAILIKLIIQPLITYQMITWINLNTIAKQVATIETAMPSAILVAIYARQYNCKPELVSTTVLVTLIASLISVTTLFYVLF